MSTLRYISIFAVTLLLGGCASQLASLESGLSGISTTAQSNIAAIAKMSVPDLQAADADAKAHGDNAADQCYAKLVTVAQAMAGAPTGSVGMVTTFQAARDAARLVEGQGDVAIACAALNASVKSDVLDLGLLFALP